MSILALLVSPPPATLQRVPANDAAAAAAVPARTWTPTQRG